MSEFDIIRRYFTVSSPSRADVRIGIGDDAAIVQPAAGHELAITTDTLVSGIHFPETTSPYDIGHKALAVNLSDLAAMGATPAWVTLALTLPEENSAWLTAFAEGFFALAHRHGVQLIGGDLTRGPLSITVQALGQIPAGQAICRSGAQPGDLIYVSGTLGDAGLGLRAVQTDLSLDATHFEHVLTRLNRPEPRISLGESLRSIASSAIDLSDGLAADLGHILEKSQTGATLIVDHLPLSEALTHSVSFHDACEFALTAGDDYELCFTLPPAQRALLEERLTTLSCRVTCIGEITAEPGLNLRYQNGSSYHGSIFGYQHF
jgi:thiamine-monophosphate kinase